MLFLFIMTATGTGSICFFFFPSHDGAALLTLFLGMSSCLSREGAALHSSLSHIIHIIPSVLLLKVPSREIGQRRRL